MKKRMYIRITESLCCTAEMNTNIVNQLYFNERKSKKKRVKTSAHKICVLQHLESFAIPCLIPIHERHTLLVVKLQETTFHFETGWRWNTFLLLTHLKLKLWALLMAWQCQCGAINNWRQICPRNAFSKQQLKPNFLRDSMGPVPHEFTITFSCCFALPHVSLCFPLFLCPLFRSYWNVLPFSRPYDLDMVRTLETLKVINYGKW